MNATPIRSGEQSGTAELESFMATIQDLTPVEEMVRLRAEFLGMVSHELRAPLSSIKGSAATLLESPPPSWSRRRCASSSASSTEQADNMRGLIGDLLDVARIEAGTLPVDPEPSDLTALVDRAKNTFLQRRGPEQPGNRSGGPTCPR